MSGTNAYKGNWPMLVTLSPFILSPYKSGGYMDVKLRIIHNAMHEQTAAKFAIEWNKRIRRHTYPDKDGNWADQFIHHHIISLENSIGMWQRLAMFVQDRIK